jgi:hypothetical protein
MVFLKSNNINRLFLSTILIFSSPGCGMELSPTATGGILGIAGGAGAGAIVGTLISRGDVLASSLLGGAIGLPLGLALGYAWQMNSEKYQQAALISRYVDNQELIMQQEREIEALREEAEREIPKTMPDSDLKQYQYIGSTLGGTRY